jgi:hypothetical protein
LPDRDGPSISEAQLKECAVRRLGVSLALLALLSLLAMGGAMGRHMQAAAMPVAHAHASHACCPAESPLRQGPVCPHLPLHFGAPLAALASPLVLAASRLVRPGAARPLVGHDVAPATPPPRPGAIA